MMKSGSIIINTHPICANYESWSYFPWNTQQNWLWKHYYGLRRPKKVMPFENQPHSFFQAALLLSVRPCCHDSVCAHVQWSIVRLINSCLSLFFSKSKSCNVKKVISVDAAECRTIVAAYCLTLRHSTIQTRSFVISSIPVIFLHSFVLNFLVLIADYPCRAMVCSKPYVIVTFF